MMPKKPDLITQKLKSYYDSVQDEAIPDRFVEMLDRLEEAEKAAVNKKTDTADD